MKRSFSLLLAFIVVLGAMSATNPFFAHDTEIRMPNHNVERYNPKNNKKIRIVRRYNGKQKAFETRKMG